MTLIIKFEVELELKNMLGWLLTFAFAIAIVVRKGSC
jgi:hypothetical protein